MVCLDSVCAPFLAPALFIQFIPSLVYPDLLLGLLRPTITELQPIKRFDESAVGGRRDVSAEQVTHLFSLVESYLGNGSGSLSLKS